MSGTVEAIWIKRARRGPMESVSAANFVRNRGIVGNADQAGRRQVTVIEREVFERIARAVPDAEPSMRRANLMVCGVRLRDSRGKVLTMGAVRILIGGETRPCERMDAQCAGLTAALEADWGGGVYGIVIDDGEVRPGDPVELRDATAEESATVPSRRTRRGGSGSARGASPAS